MKDTDHFLMDAPFTSSVNGVLRSQEDAPAATFDLGAGKTPATLESQTVN
jgi:hypothetical protein